MKTIWIIDHYSSEPKHGGVSRQYDFAKELSKRGYKVVIIASSFSHYTHSYISEDNGGIFEQNLIPNLTEIAKNNINFSHTEKIGGGVNLEGTSWTVAGLLSKMSGVPYFNPFGKDSNQNKTCLNNAIILSDILDQYGYTQIFAMGSEKQFEDRDILLENHKIVWCSKKTLKKI